MMHLEAMALYYGATIKGRVWQSFLLIWSLMLVCGMAKVEPPLLLLSLYQLGGLAALVCIDYFNDSIQNEVVLLLVTMFFYCAFLLK